MLGVFLVSFVSAYYCGGFYRDPIDGFGRGMEQVILLVENTLGPFFSVLLGGSGEMLFERVLFLFVVLAIVYVVTSKMNVFKDNKIVIWIVTIAVSLLSTRFLLETDVINSIILPYTVLGVSLSAILPLIIYFTFVQSFTGSATLRKLLWIFFIVVFVGIWGSRYSSLGELSWIYFFTAVAALIFLLFDGTIQHKIIKQRRERQNIDNKEQDIARVRKELSDLRRDRSYYDPVAYQRLEKQKMKELERIQKLKY